MGLLLRSRLPIAEATALPSTFEYLLEEPEGGWDALTGDLLCRHLQRRRFLGQALVPLRLLVDGAGASVHGGTQSQRDRWIPLTHRDGSRAEGKLHLVLRLELPPDEALTPPSSPPPSPRQERARRRRRAAEKKKKKKKTMKKSKNEKRDEWRSRHRRCSYPQRRCY